jgi:putative endonuclease
MAESPAKLKERSRALLRLSATSRPRINFSLLLCPMYYVYLLQSCKDPSRRYIGFTEDLRTRIADHNEGKNPSTSPFRPWHLQTYLAFSSKKQALSFEKHIKSGSGQSAPDTIPATPVATSHGSFRSGVTRVAVRAHLLSLYVGDRTGELLSMIYQTCEEKPPCRQAS